MKKRGEGVSVLVCETEIDRENGFVKDNDLHIWVLFEFLFVIFCTERQQDQQETVFADNSM